MKQQKPSGHRKIPMTLGDMLRQHREAAGLPVAEMAVQLQISGPHLSRLERDEIAHPSPGLLLRITKRLGIRPENIYALTGVLLPSDLPDLLPYLRAKHPDWPDLVVAELDDYYAYLKHRHSLN